MAICCAALLAAQSLAGCGFVYDPTCQDMSITTQAFPDGEVGKDYQTRIDVDSNCNWWRLEGRNFTEFRIPDADLPPGIDNDAMGMITGTPTTAGIYNFTVTAINLTHFIEKKRSYSITIRQAPATSGSLQ